MQAPFISLLTGHTSNTHKFYTKQADIRPVPPAGRINLPVRPAYGKPMVIKAFSWLDRCHFNEQRVTRRELAKSAKLLLVPKCGLF